jgi:hypothetical protein
MSTDDTIGFFGHPDARIDRLVFKQYMPTEAYQSAKKGMQGSNFFITGVFGSGKSAVKYHVKDTAGNKAFVWLTDDMNLPEQTLDFNQLRKHAGSIANVTLNTLLWELSNRILTEASSFSNDSVKQLKTIFPSIIGRFLKIANATTLQDPFGVIQLDLDKLLENKGGSLAKTMPIEDWQQALLPCLEERPAYILLDDVELIYPGLDNILEALDGLLYACELLNERFGEHLTFLVFIQWSTFVRLQRSSMRFEKISARMERIRWSSEELKMLLVSRVKQRLDLPKETSPEDTLSFVFEFKSHRDLGKLLSEATGLCVNGPRDLIAICNKAYDVTGQNKISSKHIRKIQPDFGDMKLFGIEREFNARYPSIKQFIEHSFTDKDFEYTPKDFALYISSLLPKARSIFGNIDWLTAASRQVIGILFEVGFVGYKRTKRSSPRYVINEPFAHLQPEFHTSYKFVVHPAFRARLGLRAMGDSSKDIRD